MNWKDDFEFQCLLELLRVSPPDRILELECGEGELSARLAKKVPEGMVVGMDSSEERMRSARLRCRDLENTMFLEGGAESIPWQDGFFSAIISHAPPADLREVLRVLMPGGVFLAIGSAQLPGFVEAEAHTISGQQVVVGRKP